MPGVEDTLRTALVTDPAVSALVGDRVYPGIIPDDDDPAPWISFTVPTEEPSEVLDSNDADRVEVEFELFAETYQQMRDLKDAVRAVLNRFRGGYVRRCLWSDGDYTQVEGGHQWTDRYTVWASAVDLGTVAMVWGPTYLVWGP